MSTTVYLITIKVHNLIDKYCFFLKKKALKSPDIACMAIIWSGSIPTSLKDCFKQLQEAEKLAS